MWHAYLVPIVAVGLPVEALQDDLVAIAQRWPRRCRTASLHSQEELSLQSWTAWHILAIVSYLVGACSLDRVKDASCPNDGLSALTRCNINNIW